MAEAGVDAVHGYLSEAFTLRVEQAITANNQTITNTAITAQLAGLDRVSRYKVDRLREASNILEPIERPDAIQGFSSHQRDSRGEEFAELRSVTNLSDKAKEIAKLVDIAKTDNDKRVRLLDGVLSVLFELPEASAAPILQSVCKLIPGANDKHAVLYANALVAAGHFGRVGLISELLGSLATAMRSTSNTDLQHVLDRSIKALRRIGLRAEVAELLAQAEKSLPDSRPDVLRARLSFAAGLAYMGNTSRALQIMEQAKKALSDTSAPLGSRLELTRSLALAYAQAPIGDALAGIADLSNQLNGITDSFGTNSHYCLSVLHFVESLVFGIASDDLALGEAGRRFVEDDEYLIRRRVHKDLGNQ